MFPNSRLLHLAQKSRLWLALTISLGFFPDCSLLAGAVYQPDCQGGFPGSGRVDRSLGTNAAHPGNFHAVGTSFTVKQYQHKSHCCPG